MSTETWVVGNEYDEAAFGRLKRTLAHLGYAVRDQGNAIGGSQELDRWTAEGPRGRLAIESETYIGLSVQGPAALVADLKAQYTEIA